MKILDPQSAVLTNVEVLAHLTLNPPHRPPQPPPNARNFTPHPDLRDHNTVVKEFHNYVTRLSPHLLNYPSFTPKSEPTSSTEPNGVVGTGITSDAATEPTDLDIALRALITNLKPFNLTKAEVLTIINLGVGLDTSTQGEGQVEEGAPDAAATTTEAGGDDDTIMQDGNAANGEVPVGEANGEGEEEMGEAEDGDYGALALLDTVIEDREERLSNEDVSEILRIVRETLGKK